jgi:succinate dehydrogenase / fumarate reductase cytochrome b subunit
MAQTARPLSPHLSVYRWQVQMVISILHRATGIALAVGSVALLCGLAALARGPEAWAGFAAAAGSPLGQICLIGWTWSLCLHLLNGLRHLVEDTGLALQVKSFVASGWVVAIGSLVLTAAIWACVLLRGGAA